MMNILLVCSGNVSRSFLAMALLRHALEALGPGEVEVSSAGLFAYPGSPADPQMIAYLLEKGLPVPLHEARQMNEEDSQWADLIVVMEKDHARTIESLWPRAGHKVKLLGAYLSQGQYADDIMDPFGKTPYHYRLAQSQISLAVEALAGSLRESGDGNLIAQD